MSVYGERNPRRPRSRHTENPSGVSTVVWRRSSAVARRGRRARVDEWLASDEARPEPETDPTDRAGRRVAEPPGN